MLWMLVWSCAGEPEGSCTVIYDDCESGLTCSSCTTGPDWMCSDGWAAERQCSVEQYCYPSTAQPCSDLGDDDDGGSCGATIRCNDGSCSPSCTSCTSGCCSGHGGCE